jgi:glutamate formiminotransferase
LALADIVLAEIDMRQHRGIHPRIGALDVLPFVPLADTTMADAIALARETGRALAERHVLPVYYYGEAARRPARRALRPLRHGEYEGLPARLAAAEGQPDDGPARFDPRAGAMLVGARGVLVAYNVWLASNDLGVARAIARQVRASNGGLPAVQALGLPLASRGRVQVSMNLLDVSITPIPVVYDRVADAAARLGVGVERAELVGLAPRSAFAGRAPASVGLRDFTPARELDTYLASVAGG